MVRCLLGTRSRSQLAGLEKSLRSVGTAAVVQDVEDQSDDDADNTKEDISGDEEEVDAWTPPLSIRGRRRTRSPQPSTSKGPRGAARSKSGASTPKTPRLQQSPGCSDEGNVI